MKAEFRERINPTVPVNQSGKSAKNDAPVEKTDIDFLKVMLQSNAEVKGEREAKASGDLSSAKSYDEFLNKLSEQTRQERTPNNKLEKDDFLKLFVTQLQNQDPLSPDDSTEMASRLAQFNSLEQMTNLNTSVDKLLKAQLSNRNMDMVNYVGKEVKREGVRVELGGDKAKFQVELGKPVQIGTLDFYDDSGKKVAQKEVGSLRAGDHTFEWDGIGTDLKNAGQKLPPGNYSVRLTVKDNNDIESSVPLFSTEKISGIDLKDETGMVFTDQGKLSLDNILVVREPKADKKINQEAPRKTTDTNDKTESPPNRGSLE